MRMSAPDEEQTAVGDVTKAIQDVSNPIDEVALEQAAEDAADAAVAAVAAMDRQREEEQAMEEAAEAAAAAEDASAVAVGGPVEAHAPPVVEVPIAPPGDEQLVSPVPTGDPTVEKVNHEAGVGAGVGDETSVLISEAAGALN